MVRCTNYACIRQFQYRNSKGPDRLVQRMLIVPTTINPEKKACCEIPTRVHPHLPGLMLNQYTTWLASQESAVKLIRQFHYIAIHDFSMHES